MSERSQLAVHQTESNGLTRALATVDTTQASCSVGRKSLQSDSELRRLPVLDAEAWCVETELLVVAMPRATMDLGFELQWLNGGRHDGR